jgi:hypothetical protein
LLRYLLYAGKASGGSAQIACHAVFMLERAQMEFGKIFVFT